MNRCFTHCFHQFWDLQAPLAMIHITSTQSMITSWKQQKYLTLSSTRSLAWLVVPQGRTRAEQPREMFAFLLGFLTASGRHVGPLMFFLFVPGIRRFGDFHGGHESQMNHIGLQLIQLNLGPKTCSRSSIEKDRSNATRKPKKVGCEVACHAPWVVSTFW